MTFDLGSNLEKLQSGEKFSLKESMGGNVEKTKEGKQQPTQADILIKIGRLNYLFIDQHGDPFVAINEGGYRHIHPLRHKIFKRWLHGKFFEETGKSPNTEAMESALKTLEYFAWHEDKKHTLHNRICWHDGAIWYDLSNDKWQAVRIDKNGWKVVSEPPILFRRFSHQRPQVLPVSNSDISTLRVFLSPTKSEEHKLLIIVWLMSCFIPDFPHCILVLYGDKGSGKSLLMELLKWLVDPSEVDTVGLIKDYSNFVQALSHHWVIGFDNLSVLSGDMQDTLSRAVTGSSHIKRKLYTDEDDVILKFKRCLLLNGINIPATKPDILDRCLLIPMKRLEKKERKAEKRIKEDFKKILPQLLGVILTVVSKSLSIKDEIELNESPRMVDFTQWGCAVAEAMGIRKERFLDIYYNNIRFQNAEVIGSNPLAVAVLCFMQDKKEWEGSSSELLDELEDLADERDIKQKIWPKANNVLTRRLNEIKTNLKEFGVEFNVMPGKLSNSLCLQKYAENTSDTSTTSTLTENQGLIGESIGGSISNTSSILPTIPPTATSGNYKRKEQVGDSGSIFPTLLEDAKEKDYLDIPLEE